ncbi:MAG: hypothetical protein L6Q92_04760 [Phycisphaerae bacterium]|nr:hypothetical protein [Phycisphaerae bacterium]
MELTADSSGRVWRRIVAIAAAGLLLATVSGAVQALHHHGDALHGERDCSVCLFLAMGRTLLPTVAVALCSVVPLLARLRIGRSQVPVLLRVHATAAPRAPPF